MTKVSNFLLVLGHKFEDVADLSQLSSSEVLNVLSNEVKYFLADEGT